MFYVLRIAGAANIILADFNLAVSTPTTKPPNLNPRQIFRLYGTYVRTWRLKRGEGVCSKGGLFLGAYGISGFSVNDVN